MQVGENYSRVAKGNAEGNRLEKEQTVYSGKSDCIVIPKIGAFYRIPTTNRHEFGQKGAKPHD